MNRLLRRLPHAWAVLTGRIILPNQLLEMQIMSDLSKTAASLAALSDSVDRLIAKSQNDASTISSLQQTVSTADDQTSQTIDAVTAKIDAIVPPPPAGEAPTMDAPDQ